MEKRILNRDLFEKATSEGAIPEEVMRWASHLCEILTDLGYQVCLTQKGFELSFEVNGESLASMLELSPLEAKNLLALVTDNLSELRVEWYPEFALCKN